MKWIIGIDEVGRGALAGPVVVAAAAVREAFSWRSVGFGRLKDSKKMSPVRREKWSAWAEKSAAVRFSIARVYPRQIEKQNISRAANIAAERALGRLMEKEKFGGATPIFLDGGLFVGNHRAPRYGNGRAKTLVKADETVPAVAIASVVAKVCRDRLMRRLAKRYPGYSFEVHKGYGTYRHRRTLARRGPCAAHRLTFTGKSSIIKKK